jgi:hypothetical protein
MENVNEEVRKEFTISIKGWAYSKEKSELENVKAFDEFAQILFEKYREVLLWEFEKQKELSYDEMDTEQKQMIDPYLSNFSFDTVTKDVR